MTITAAMEMLPVALECFGQDWENGNVEDIFVVGPGHYFVRINGKTERREAPGMDALTIEAIAAFAGHLRGQYADASTPILDCELPNGDRLNIALPPVTPDGKPSLALRRQSEAMPNLDDLDEGGLWDLVKAREAANNKNDAHAERIAISKTLLRAGEVNRFFRQAISWRWSIAAVGETGSGKAQPLHSKILTPTGWKTMGSIKIGDPVTCPDGSLANVNGVFPQGKKLIWRVTFGDGRTVECCGDHLWKVWDWKVKYETGKSHTERKAISGADWSVLPLHEIIKWFEGSGRKGDRAAIPLIEPFAIEFAHKELPLDPYALGALIGDGCFQKSGIQFTSIDSEIVQRLNDGIPDYDVIQTKCNYQQYYLKLKERKRGGSIFVAMNVLGLWGKRSHEKFIPDAYKQGSVGQRLALMQGLFDTDGSVGNGTHATFTTTSEQLAKDVQEIAWSLGGIATINNRQTHFTYKGEKKAGKPSYRVSVVHPDVQKFFSVPRKVSQCKAKNMRHRLRIVSIEPVGFMEAQCISINHKDHLYITDDYIVTHNTHDITAITNEIPIDERIITIGNVEELKRLPHPNRVSFLYSKGGPVTAEDLIEASLRNAPRWLVVQEIRGAEAFAYLRALASGHPGITTWHARSAERAFDPLTSMVRQHPAGALIPEDALRSMMRAFVDVVVHVERNAAGEFRATDIRFGSEMP